MERQIHGFTYEDFFIKKFSLIKEPQYTERYDAYGKNGTPFKIKSIKKGSSIDLADYFRNAEESKNFFLAVSFWDRIESNIVEEYVITIKSYIWRELLYFKEKERMREWIKTVSNEREYDEQWKDECLFFKNEWNKEERKIQLRFKRDHKSQKRIQCAINNNDWYYYLKNFEVIEKWIKR